MAGRIIFLNIIIRKANKNYVCLKCGKTIWKDDEYYSIEGKNRHRTVCLECGSKMSKEDWIQVFKENPIYKWNWKGKKKVKKINDNTYK